MVTTVKQAFEQFNANIVNLDSNKSTRARKSRDWLYENLNKFQNNPSLDFPDSYKEKHKSFGSFARKTKIRKLDDIDLMFCLSANYAYYHKNFFGTNYEIHTENACNKLKKLSDNDKLNSRKVIEYMKSSLVGIPQYTKADIHRNQEAVTLQMSSYEWNFDIIPCFYTTDDFYLIPDGDGGWKATNPNIDQMRLTEENQQKNGRLLQLIRTLKYWNRYNATHTVGSYLFENLVIEFSKSKNDLSEYIDFNIRDFLVYFSEKILHDFNDPKGFQGNINYLDYQDRKAVSDKAKSIYNKVLEAIRYETENKNIQASINKWKEVFGQEFPTYG